MKDVENERLGHAGPVQAGDDVVDAGLALETNDLVRDFLGRAYQEAIPDKLVEVGAEAVAGGHGAILAPLTVDLVFGGEEGLAQATRFFVRAGDEDFTT